MVCARVMSLNCSYTTCAISDSDQVTRTFQKFSIGMNLIIPLHHYQITVVEHYHFILYVVSNGVVAWHNDIHTH